MSFHAWLKTYRGTVFHGEVDHHDHLTVAYDGTRIADASGSGRPPRAPHPRDVTCHTQTPAAPGAR